MAKKKNPFIYKEETPPGSLTRGLTVTEGKAPVQRIDLTKDQGAINYIKSATGRAQELETKKNTPKLIRNKKTGEVTGVILPDGKSYTGDYGALSRVLESWKNLNPGQDPLEEQIQGEIDREKLKTKMVQEQTPVNPLIQEIGQLTPEQQALANSNAELSGRPSFMNVLKSAGERASIAGAGGAVTGAIGGSVVPGVGTLAGAGIVGIGAGVVAGVTGIFSEYKRVDKANVDTASNNFNTALENMNQAISLADKGAGNEANLRAIKNYNEGLAQIRLAERQLKELSNDQTKYKEEIRTKLTEINDFYRNDKPRMDLLLETALQKPTAKYINQGGVQ